MTKKEKSLVARVKKKVYRLHANGATMEIPTVLWQVMRTILFDGEIFAPMGRKSTKDFANKLRELGEVGGANVKWFHDPGPSGKALGPCKVKVLDELADFAEASGGLTVEEMHAPR
jgi:hypothetical protein